MGRDPGPAERVRSGLPGEAVGPTLKARLMERIKTEERLHPHRGRARPRPLSLAAVAWPLSLALAVVLAAAWTRSRREVARLAMELGAAQAEAAQLRGRVVDQRGSQLDWLRDPGVQLAMLSGRGSAPEARARLLYSPSAQEGLLWVHGLPKLPEPKTYALWAFLGTVPARVGVFGVQGVAPGAVSLQDEDLAHATRFAVSVEPGAAGPVPRGEVVLLGEVPSG